MDKRSQAPCYFCPGLKALAPKSFVIVIGIVIVLLFAFWRLVSAEVVVTGNIPSAWQYDPESCCDVIVLQTTGIKIEPLSGDKEVSLGRFLPSTARQVAADINHRCLCAFVK